MSTAEDLRYAAACESLNNIPIGELRQIAMLDFKNLLLIEGAARGFRVPRFQLIAADFMQGAKPEWINSKKMIRGFRLAAKSYLGRAFARFRQLRVPETQVIIHSSSGPNANKFVRAYYNELRRSPLTEHLAPPEDSSELKFNLLGVRPEQGYSVEAAGLGTGVTGSRADLYMLDDPEPDDDPEGFYHRVLKVIVEAGNILHSPRRHLPRDIAAVPPIEATQLLVLCQPHWSGSAYILPGENEMIELGEDDRHPLADAAVLDIPVINETTGYWTWPEMMEQKYYDHARNRPKTVAEVENSMPRETWELQMMINPKWMATAGAALNLKMIKRIRQQCSGNVMLVDPADSEEGCEWGVSIAGLADDLIHFLYIGGFVGEAYEGDVEDESIFSSTWGQIFNLADEFKVHRVLVEKNLKTAASAARRFLSKTGMNIAVDFYQASGNKLRRIVNSIEQPVNNGMCSADPTVFADAKTLRQFTKLRFNKLPAPCDRLDSAAALVAWMVENRGIVSTTVTPMNNPVAFERAVESVSRRGIADRDRFTRIGRG